MATKNGKRPITEARMLTIYCEDARGREVIGDKAVNEVRLVTDHKGRMIEKVVTPLGPAVRFGRPPQTAAS